MKIYYWSPFTSKVATIKAVINSAYSMNKFYNHETYIINSFGEWDYYKNDLKNKNIKIIESKKKIKTSLKNGFFLSRLLYLRIFLNSFLILKKIIERDKPDFLIAHLITSLPILLFNLFNFKTKLILRISGFPKLNLFRKYFWKFSNHVFFKITTPTKQTYTDIKKLQIFDRKKLQYLPDPVFLKKDISKKFKNKINSRNYILNIGRLTKQKNQKFLINAFRKIQKKYNNLSLIILGEEGEMKNELSNLVKIYNLDKKITFLNHVNIPFKIIKNSKCVIVSSLWEDPGFVMIETAALKKPIICSNCPNGPLEFFSNGKSGFLFKSNNEKSLLHTFDKFMNMNKKMKNKFLEMNFKKSLNFSDKEHSKELNLIINEK